MRGQKIQSNIGRHVCVPMVHSGKRGLHQPCCDGTTTTVLFACRVHRSAPRDQQRRFNLIAHELSQVELIQLLKPFGGLPMFVLATIVVLGMLSFVGQIGRGR